ncbi:hypothetical protein [Herbidospora sp. NBRC 101105]|uniref:hypothetical protein n=1 Tax=Herbidospora sp. NBRC 101105 TaxID=3032195 RepID=UPI0025522334|nr:hypothetical protein [Herbidospora sp. NBRC 101105]
MMQLEELAACFPTWSIWRSESVDGTGSWYATCRAHRITGPELAAGVCMTVDAPSLDVLHVLLNAQAACLARVDE